MKGIGLSILVLALGGMTLARAAAPPACGPRQSAVRRMFCSHPALAAMDRSVQVLAATTVRATTRQRRAARRDQRLWQAERDDVLWRMASNPSFTEDQIVRRAWRLERSRQAFLLGRTGQGAVPSPALARMARVLRAHPDVAGDPLRAWARFDHGVVLAGSLDAGPGHAVDPFARVELRPDAELRERIDEVTGGSPLDLLWLPEARLGAVVSVQGTADCQLTVWFRADRAGVAHGIPAPMPGQIPCGHTRLTLLRVGLDTYVALERFNGAYAVDVSMRQWLGTGWAGPLRLRPRYQHALRVSQLRCAHGDCARYAAVIKRIARRYDARPMGPNISAPNLRPGERIRVRQLLWMAQRDRKTSLGTLPLAGDEPLADFCSDASFFVVRVDGRLLLGRIGHGYLGWRRSDGWRIGLWGVKGGKLVPLAGAVIRRPRGRLLALAAMPPKGIPTGG